MKRIYLILIVLVGISVSCTKNFEDWQKDEKRPTEVPGEMLFTNAQKALVDQVASTNVNVNNYKLYAQYWTETTYTDEANYDLINRNIPDNVFRVLYRDVLRDLREAKTLITASEATSLEVVAKNNKLMIIDILEVYTFQRLVDIFGNVPYSEALDIDATLNPAYDDGLTIYKDLFARLDAAIAGLQDGDSYGGADIIYGGDVASWKAFAYSLQLRMAVTIADAGDPIAKTAAEAASSHTFASSADNATLQYASEPLANTNPLYQDLIASGRKDFVPANTLVDIMNGLNDPRRAAYFELNPDANGEEYVGGTYGSTSAYGNFSHIGAVINEPTFPFSLMTYTEVEFLKAEAAARGWNVGGTALEHYTNGVTSSFADWGVDGAAAYISTIGWDGATDWKKAIGMQAYLAYYTRGFEAWTTIRRLDWPTMNVPEAAVTTDGGIPRRFTFPVNEQTLNKTNYYQAADAVGGDFMETKLFWDKY